MTPPRVLLGPVPGRFADDHLAPARRAGACLTFGPGADADFRPGDTWAAVRGRLPAGWVPDAILLNLAYTVLPAGAAAAGVPVVGYAPDWPLHWHYYRLLAPRLDRLWTDARGAERLAAAGVANARAVVPFGRPAAPPGPDLGAARDLDLVWAGNFNPAVHHDRHRWIGVVAGFAGRYRVRVANGLDPRAVRPLFERARVAFLPAFHGGWDGLVAEAIAAGAVVVRDTEVREVPDGLTPGREYVRFDNGNLEAALGGLLADEPGRAAVAAAGRARAGDFGTAALWDRAVAILAAELDDLRASAARRVAPEPGWELRHWQGLNTRTAVPEPVAAGAPATEQFAAAVRAAWADRGKQIPASALDRLSALLSDPDAGPSAALHLADLLAGSGRDRDAAPLARRVLEAASGGGELPPLALGWGPLRPGFDAFRVEWERAGWANAGDPAAEAAAKRALLRARCDLLLGQVTDDPARVVRAAATAPGYLPAVKAAGPAAARIDSPAAAVPLFEHALAADPFDRDLARAFEGVLGRAGDADRLARFRAARDRLAAVLPAAKPKTLPASPRRQRVSLTMIVRDEEANLPACLDSARDLVDEVVVVDTGSTDRTPELAAARGARVVPFAWRDDFAAARNAGLDAARGDWVFWLDADERLDPANRDRVRRAFAGLRDENAAYLMRQLSPSEDAAGATTAVDQLRLFRNRPDVRWEYRIHEQILLAVRRTGADVRPTDVVIDHRGYVGAALRDRKLGRNTRLLELAHRERPDDPILAFNLAWVYQKAGRPADALPLLEHARRVLPPRVSVVPKVYRLLGQVLARLGRAADAHAAFAAGRRLYPEDVELLLHHGLLLQRGKDYAAAEACFRRVLALPAGAYPVGLDLGLKGYKTRNALADLFLEQGRLGEAEAEWRAALAEQPGFGPAHVGLAAVELARGRPGAAEAILDRLTPTDPDTRAGAERLRRRLRPGLTTLTSLTS